ncbi:MAG: glutamine synthetase family protein [Clostridiales bacterium]|nr:glutamine synthetase family protein [Clostridiales bacterium]
MNLQIQDVRDFIEQEDISFIRLAFCDVFGRQKNVSVMKTELDRAFETGIAIDASAVKGFGSEEKSDLFLFPDPSTLAVLPWRPSEGGVVRMYCDIRYPDGTPFEMDCRRILKNAVGYSKSRHLNISFGAEYEFYLFKTDDDGYPTKQVHDKAGYMDIAPDDRGANIRRSVCLTLSEMGIIPESSHHEEGPGQHEIDFKYGEPLSSADNSITFKSAVSTIAQQYGLFADFSPKPLENESGNGLHINISVKSDDGNDYLEKFMAGIMNRIKEMTAFLNPVSASYGRLGVKKAPRYITWSKENRSQLVRIPAGKGEYRRMELRSPDPMTNPYIAYALLIYAGIEGIEKDIPVPASTDINLYSADEETLSKIEKLPESLEEANKEARNSNFIKSVLPQRVIDTYTL